MKVFVYGTLKKGMSNHRLLEGAEYVGEDYIRGYLYDLGSYPAARPSASPDHVISGEVYEINHKTLQRLDQLEGVPHHYTRDSVFTERFGERVWVYFYANPIPDRLLIGSRWPEVK